MIITLATAIYEAQKLYNIQLRRKVDELKPYWWPCFAGMDTMYQIERYKATRKLLNCGIPSNIEAYAAERHKLGVQTKIKHGYVLGDRRIESLRTDPYLLPLQDCPNWFQEWCIDRDAIAFEILTEYMQGAHGR